MIAIIVRIGQMTLVVVFLLLFCNILRKKEFVHAFMKNKCFGAPAVKTTYIYYKLIKSPITIMKYFMKFHEMIS